MSVFRNIIWIVATTLFLALASIGPSGADTRVALVIGNGAYRNAPQLPNPSNDANDVAAALRRSGFETIVAIDLDRNGMEDATIRFARAARSADVAMFYYSGHALQFGGVNYLVPIDAKLTDESDLRRMARVDDIVADLQQAKNLRILVLDSCRDNPLAEQLKRSIGMTRAVSLQRGLAKIDSPQGMIVAYATQAGRTADDGTGRNSPYTAAFLKNIENEEEIGTIFRQVSEDVYETTRHEQLPELSLSVIGKFYLRGKINVTIVPQPPKVDPCTSAGDHWKSAEAIGTRAAFEDHLKLFSSCAFAGLARARIEMLQTKSAALVVPPKPATRQSPCKDKVIAASLTDECVIKIGNIMPYTGPAPDTRFATVGKVEAAYFKKINAEGGINGRRIQFLSYDNSSSPTTGLEQVRKLVEDDKVAAVFSPLHTPTTNAMIRDYLNKQEVPQLFVASPLAKWGDPSNFPWTMGWEASFQAEGRVYARYILANRLNARIAVLYENNDFGKDLLKGFKDGLGSKASEMIVREEAYSTSEPTIDSRVVFLKSSNADVFVNIATPKFAAQAIAKIAELGWKPMQFVSKVSTSVPPMFGAAGQQSAQGIFSSRSTIDPGDPMWRDHPAVREWQSFMKTYYPEGDVANVLNVYGYNMARTLVQVLKQCGDDLGRANIMKQAANLKDFDPGLLAPGIKINTSSTDFFPIEQLQMIKFERNYWQPIGAVIDGH